MNIPGGRAEFEIINVYEHNRSVRPLLDANCMAGSLLDDLLRPDPWGS